MTTDRYINYTYSMLERLLDSQLKPSIRKKVLMEINSRSLPTFDFCLLHNMRRYSVNLRERDYPTFEGKYNAYISVYGQLSGEYLGDIEYPMAMEITPEDVPYLLNTIDLPAFIHGTTPAI